MTYTNFNDNSNVDVILCSSGTSVSATVSNNTIVVASGKGIECQGNVTGATVSSNTITGTSASTKGILHGVLSASSATITNNTISGFSNGVGIGLTAGAPSVTKNTVSGCKYGIECRGGTPAIGNNNSASDNVLGVSGSGNTHGLRTTSSSATPSVRNNQIRYNVYGVTADSSSTPDLGTASSNGKNSLVSNTNACIVNNTTGTISAIGNYFAQADCYASPTCVSGLVDVSGWLCTPPLSAEWPVETVPKPSQIGLRLLGASPNPFVTATEIHFAVEKSDLRLQVELFNSSGRLVTTLRDHTFSRGTTSLSWDGRDEMGRLVPNGLYFVRFSTELGSTVGKIVVAR